MIVYLYYNHYYRIFTDVTDRMENRFMECLNIYYINVMFPIIMYRVLDHICIHIKYTRY